MKEVCVLYVRVSTEDQVRQYGLDAQLSDLRAHAKQKGYQVAKEFRDEGYSGGNLDRPALTELRELFLSGKAGVLLVYDPDRLARNLTHQLILVDEIERAGARTEFVTTPMDASPEGRMFFQMKGVFAEFEKEKIRDRTMRGRRQKAKAGFIVCGTAPYGYDYQGKSHGERGRYVVNEREASVVRQIFAWLLDGLSTRGITARLNAGKVQPKRGLLWGKSSVRRILSNTVYHGLAYYNQRQTILPKKAAGGQRRNKKTAVRTRPFDEWIPIEVPAIISEKTFLEAQDKLRDNSTKLVGRNTRYVYMLRSLLWCGDCGAKLAGCPSHRRRFYRCTSKDRLSPRNCSAGLVQADRLETFVWGAVSHCLRQPDLLLAKLNEFYVQVQSERENLADRARELRRRLAEIDVKQSRLLDDYLENNNFDRSVISRKAESLAVQREEVQKEISRVDRKQELASEVQGRDQQIEQFYKLAIRGLDVLDIVGRQQVLRELIDEVRLTGREIQIRGLLPGRKPWPDQAVNRSQHATVLDTTR